MIINLIPSESRGFADHGWLVAKHSFSFANYLNPNRMHFGVLRVLNDDYIAPGMGFGMHPHQDMEIITIPLSGELHHQDSMGNFGKITKGEIQVMSAGTGIEHSEFNGLKDEALTLLQIWLFPNKLSVEPRYDQISIKENAKVNNFQQIVSPNKDDEGLWIHQNAWFSIGEFKDFTKTNYNIKRNGNGVYVFILKGSVKIADENLYERDAIEISEIDSFDMEISENSEILIMDIPMQLHKL